MSFSFDDTMPTDRDRVRFRLNDIDSTDAVLSDEAIDSLLDQLGFEQTLLQGCNAIKLTYGKRASAVTLPSRLKASYFDRYKAYADLYDQLFALYGTEASQDGVRNAILPQSVRDEIFFDRLEPLAPPLGPIRRRFR